METSEEAVESAQGPGWFESSWELRRGLEVREGPPPDAALDADYVRRERAIAAPSSMTASA